MMKRNELNNTDGKEYNLPIINNDVGTTTLDVSALNKGIYFLEFNNGNKHVKKVVIE